MACYFGVNFNSTKVGNREVRSEVASLLDKIRKQKSHREVEYFRSWQQDLLLKMNEEVSFDRHPSSLEF